MAEVQIEQLRRTCGTALGVRVSDEAGESCMETLSVGDMSLRVADGIPNSQCYQASARSKQTPDRELKAKPSGNRCMLG